MTSSTEVANYFGDVLTNAVIALSFLSIGVPFIVGIFRSIPVMVATYKRLKLINKSFFEFIVFIGIGLGGGFLSFVSGFRNKKYNTLVGKNTHRLVTVHEPLNQPNLIIIWIHGLWEEPTINYKTPLLEKLKSEFPNARLLAFEWYSPNRLDCRRTASQHLAQHISNNYAGGSLPIYLIGHSHGGSVAFQAANLLGSDFPIQVISLATPFVETIPISSKTLFPVIGALIWFLSIPAIPVGLAYFKYGTIFLPLFSTVYVSESFMHFITSLLVGYVVAFALLFLFGKKINSDISDYDHKNKTINNQHVKLTAIRLQNDPLLNTMIFTHKLHKSRFASLALIDRKSFIRLKQGRLNALWDAAVKLSLMAVYIFLMAAQLLLIAWLNKRWNVDWELIAWAGYCLVLLWPTIFFALSPIRIIAWIGELTINTVRMLLPPILVLAQSNFAGTPIKLQLRRNIRIADVPRGYSINEYPKATNLTTQACISKRHRLMLEEPDVIRMVIEECKRSAGLAMVVI